MLLAQELLRSLIALVDIFFTVIYWLLVIRIILSWVGVNPYTTYNDILGALYQVTDVILTPFQRLPLRVGMIDFSALVAFIVLQLAHRLILLGLLSLSGMR